MRLRVRDATHRSLALCRAQLVAIGSYERAEHMEQVKSIKTSGLTYVTESLKMKLDRNGNGPVATALRSGKEIRLDIEHDKTSTYQRAALAEEYGVVKEFFLPMNAGVLEFGVPRSLIDVQNSHQGIIGKLKRGSTSAMLPSVENALAGFEKVESRLLACRDAMAMPVYRWKRSANTAKPLVERARVAAHVRHRARRATTQWASTRRSAAISSSRARR